MFALDCLLTFTNSRTGEKIVALLNLRLRESVECKQTAECEILSYQCNRDMSFITREVKNLSWRTSSCKSPFSRRRDNEKRDYVEVIGNGGIREPCNLGHCVATLLLSNGDVHDSDWNCLGSTLSKCGKARREKLASSCRLN